MLLYEARLSFCATIYTMTPTLSSTELPPISDPIFTHNGRSLVVLWGVMAQFKLSEWGVNAAQAWEVINPASTDPRGVFYSFSMFAAMVAHNFKPGEHVPSAQEWVVTFGEDRALIQKMMEAVAQALGKQLQAGLKRKRLAETQPAIEIPAPSTSGVN